MDNVRLDLTRLFFCAIIVYVIINQLSTMQIQFSLKQISEKDKKFLENYIEKKVERIQKLLSEQDYETANLEIRAEKFAKKEAFKIEFFLNTPTDNFMSGEDDHTVIEAFDLALDKLINQLRKQHEKLTV